MSRKLKTPAPRPIAQQRGFSLIEIMVTVIILATGLLGVAAMQVQTKRSNFEATQRSTASMLTHDIIERMRANPGELRNYLTVSDLGDGTLTTPSPACTSGATCTTTELAAYDLFVWEQAIDGVTSTRSGRNTGGLASPTGCITSTVALGTAGPYTVAIAWRGLTAISNPARNNCGATSAKYGDSNEYRRVLAITSYIDNG